VKTCREEKTLYTINYYINDTLGKMFTSNNVENMDEVFKDTDFKTPLIFILS